MTFNPVATGRTAGYVHQGGSELQDQAARLCDQGGKVTADASVPRRVPRSAVACSTEGDAAKPGDHTAVSAQSALRPQSGLESVCDRHRQDRYK